MSAAIPDSAALAQFEMAGFVLNDVFGFDDWRGVQEQVVRRLLLDKKNALCLMPTGGGKSLCYQIPSLCLPGLTVVVSPLIALMKDQVDGLRRLNVKAASMDSSLSAEEMMDVRRQISDKSLTLLYVAPERLNNESFIQMLRDLDIDLLAVDESHCVSEWGPSFRPMYMTIARWAQEMDVKRVLCLTATATPSVVEDICSATKGFNIDIEDSVFRTANYRSNLELLVRPATSFKSKIDALIPFLKSRKGAAIVYATTQNDAEDVAAALDRAGVECRFYHAGVAADNRKETQDWFINGNGVVVATIAFGMGIDKSNIRQVCHFHIPKTLENYSQEIGRAGRDGLPSTCLMLPSAADLPVLESFARSNTPARQSIADWLKAVFGAESQSDGTINFSHYHQAREFDISANTLGILYALLELQFELLRAVTPFYSTYTLKPAQYWTNVTSDKSAAAVAIRKHWKQGTALYTVDVAATVDASGMDRQELVKTLSRWEMQRACENKVSGLHNRYMPLKKMPKTKPQIDKIATQMYTQMSEREDADVKRLYQTAEFIQREGCYAAGLAEYFGDTTAVPKDGCGKCSYCLTQTPVIFDSKPVLPLDEAKVQTVLDICGVRDDARFLARLAFGISSPRITALGLSKHDVFKSCEGLVFHELVERFEQECAACEWTNKDVLAPPVAAAKAPYNKRGGGGGSDRFGSENQAPAAKKAKSSRASSSSSSSANITRIPKNGRGVRRGYGRSGYGRGG